MKIVIFGLTISSSWGNGHATLWRGLCRNLAKRGHEIIFFERDVRYYAEHRDLSDPPGVKLKIYTDWRESLPVFRNHLSEADVAIVTSYCPDGIAASRLVLESPARLKVFYDMDSPVTLEKLQKQESVFYLPPEGLADFDLVLSFTGGKALGELRSRLHAKRVAPLYGCVDPEIHKPVKPHSGYDSDLSYIGTYAPDRQNKLQQLFLEPASRHPRDRFLIAGAQYPSDFPWRENVFYIPHLPPAEHAAFYSSSRLTLNVTRHAMASMGYCPSPRIFEAAACGAAILSDEWEGLSEFFSPGTEILTAKDTNEALEALDLPEHRLKAIGRNAREKVLSFHTAEKRAAELESLLENAIRSIPVTASARAGGLWVKPKCWGIIPAAGAGTRIQPLAFSKELLPVGSRVEGAVERPRAVSEFLAERMLKGGATHICFVISPGKSDIMEYYGGKFDSADICYVVQPKPAGLCDALFRAIPLVHLEERVCIGLPDTVWFPLHGFKTLEPSSLSFLLFPVKNPEVFDAVVLDEKDHVLEIEVKQPRPKSNWIWGAFQMPGSVFHALHQLWLERDQRDEYMGTLVNEYIRRGGVAIGVRAGESYVDVGTLHGYREAIQVLAGPGAA